MVRCLRSKPRTTQKQNPSCEGLCVVTDVTIYFLFFFVAFFFEAVFLFTAFFAGFLAAFFFVVFLAFFFTAIRMGG